MAHDHGAHTGHAPPQRWVAPEDIPMAVLVIPLTISITIISTVIGMVIVF